jgi:hypothetical protein
LVPSGAPEVANGRRSYSYRTFPLAVSITLIESL